jgi:ATP adenylyltransferase
MDHLWSPWRYRYISKADSPTGCIFCDKPAASDEESLIVHRAEHNFVLLNLYPYTNGHLMIAPYAHVDTLEGASREAAIEMMELAQTAEGILRKLYRPHGINLGMNLGESAGAGVAGHIHLHMLPRWTGDANFMSVIGETRVLPEELSVTLQRMREAWPS